MMESCNQPDVYHAFYTHDSRNANELAMWDAQLPVDGVRYTCKALSVVSRKTGQNVKAHRQRLELSCIMDDASCPKHHNS